MGPSAYSATDRRRRRRSETDIMERSCDNHAFGTYRPPGLLLETVASESIVARDTNSTPTGHATKRKNPPFGVGPRTIMDVREYRNKLQQSRRPCCSWGEVPGTDAFSTWPFRKQERGTHLTPEEKKTHRVLAVLTTGELSYDEDWLFLESIDNDSGTILMCAKCRKDLRQDIVPKFSKRNGFELFDHYPIEVTDLNDLETAWLSIVIPISRIYRRKGYQQKHCLGQTITYWNSAMRVVDSIPRDATDSSIVLMRDEHGRCLLDDVPLRFDIMLKGMNYLAHNRHYSHVHTNEQALSRLCAEPAPFIVETDVIEPIGVPQANEWVGDEAIATHADDQAGGITAHCIESDEEDDRVDPTREGHATTPE